MIKTFFALVGLFLSATTWAADNPRVHIDTSMGIIELELYPHKSPKTVKNFLRYVDEGFYHGTIFHRVIKNFMIQGGGFTTDYNKKKNHDPVANEAFNGLRNNRGTIAMARTNMPHSATSQFFINTANNAPLNFTSQSLRGWGYTVFGQVTKGMDVVDKIENTPTGPAGIFPAEAPQVQIVINKIELIQ